ncbi:hypothetical protein ACN94_10405 [Gordonia paraffinivorans]|uniref:Uncharacterized protein n=1 Tax=Gordonia paraffinivorans TaxID=175628 RepID=A0ABD7V0M7_9ACTN|nr:hypothetical protein [Gordonia paraffinivorans]MBY4573994.1 hypothetical protein [Gordonia paraffinivorans]PWD44323.1 hypothetical protein ACN93_02560 [Gordonia paraffinivorans]VFA83047.1 Uncharacterised protein [Gordonia paraffinivorans]
MKKRVMASVAAAVAATGLVFAGAADASAAEVRETSTRVFVGFTPAETKQIAASGVTSILDTPELIPYYYVKPDADSRFEKFYVPGKGYVARSMAQGMVNEAAAHPNGRVWVSFNKTHKRPLTLWTQF